MKPHEQEHEAIKTWILQELADAYPAATIDEKNWFQFRYQDVKISLEGNRTRWSAALLDSSVNIRICCSVLTPAYNRIICKVPTTGGSLQKVFDKIYELNEKAAVLRKVNEEKAEKDRIIYSLQQKELPGVLPEKFNIHRQADGTYSVTFFSFLTLEQTRALIAAVQNILEQP